MEPEQTKGPEPGKNPETLAGMAAPRALVRMYSTFEQVLHPYKMIALISRVFGDFPIYVWASEDALSVLCGR